MDTDQEGTKHLRKRRVVRVVLFSALLLFGLRIMLPYLLLELANARLADIPGYTGHINDLGLSLYRGAYHLDGFNLDKLDDVSLERTPFISARSIDLSIAWGALFRGSLVGKVNALEPKMRSTKGRTEPKDVQQDTASLAQLLDDFMPLRIDRLVLKDGRLEYADEHSKPPVDLALTELQATATNLSSSVQEGDLLPAKVHATGTLYSGLLHFNMALDPLAEESLFDMDMTLENMDLTRINDLFKAYADFDVNKGMMSLYVEVASRDGGFKGYLKPVISDLDVLGREDRKDGFFRKLWEGIVGTSGAIVTNPKKDRIATKVPLSGALDDPDIGTWPAVATILRNAFIRALEPAIDREVDITSPLPSETNEKKGFLQGLFDGKSDLPDTR